ncbi:hypothetical protein AAMO2058_000747000 [Amorphochlora amoebiformis]
MESETFPILFALLLSPYLQYIRFPRMFSTTVSKLDSTSTNRNSPSLFYREKGLSQRHAQFLQLIYHGQIPEYGSIERGDILTRATKLAEETLRAISSLRGGAGRKRSRGFTEDDQARIALAAKRKSQSSRCKTGLGFSGESASKNAKHTGPGGFDEDMKNHYDNHGRKRQTMQERRQGISHPLKKFHNQVKRKMIMRFCSRHSNRSGEGLRLLDLACGRGGDLNKWGSAGISFVRGIDLSPAEIEEAKRRLSSTRRQFPRLEVAFEQSDDCGRKLLPELKGQYDAVTCMFAAHYFFKDETMAKTFLTNVKAALKPGGYFFGTVPDGKAVMTRIGNSSHFENSILVLEKKWEVCPKTYLWLFILSLSLSMFPLSMLSLCRCSLSSYSFSLLFLLPTISLTLFILTNM